MNNLSKLQSEVVKQFDQNFDQYNPRNEVGFTVPITGNGYQQIKQFLSDQIQKAYEAGLKDAVDKYFLDAEERLSIQSKGKII